MVWDREGHLGLRGRIKAGVGGVGKAGMAYIRKVKKVVRPDLTGLGVGGR